MRVCVLSLFLLISVSIARQDESKLRTKCRELLLQFTPLSAYAVPNDMSLQLFGKAGEKVFSKGKLRILIWNSAKAAKEYFMRDFDTLSAKADIVMLQEAPLNKNMLLRIGQDRKRLWIHAPNVVERKDEEIVSGVMTGAKTRAIDARTIVSDTKESITKTPKLALITTYNVEDGKKLHVVNIHGPNFIRTRNYKKELERIFSILDKLEGIVLFAGDFNSWSIGRLRFLKKMTEQKGFNLVEMNKFGASLDWAFVRGIKTFKGKRIRKIEFPGLGKTKVKSSDHKPLLLELEL